MVKEIERYKIPIVHMATIITISKSVGANRIVPTSAIPFPVGAPSLKKEEEHRYRKNLIKKALNTLTTEVESITVFED